MPLDSRKISHIQSLYLNKIFQSRTKNVVFVYESAGVYTFTAVAVIFRPQTIIDPQIPNVAGVTPLAPADMLMIAPIATNFVGLVFVADTPTATSGAVAAAAKYESIENRPVGVVPGGTHYVSLLRRLR